MLVNLFPGKLVSTRKYWHLVFEKLLVYTLKYLLILNTKSQKLLGGKKITTSSLKYETNNISTLSMLKIHYSFFKLWRIL